MGDPVVGVTVPDTAVGAAVESYVRAVTRVVLGPEAMTRFVPLLAHPCALDGGVAVAGFAMGCAVGCFGRAVDLARTTVPMPDRVRTIHDIEGHTRAAIATAYGAAADAGLDDLDARAAVVVRTWRDSAVDRLRGRLMGLLDA